MAETFPGTFQEGFRSGRPPPFLAMPYPLDEYLDALPGDYGKIARRLLRSANWEAGPSRCGRFQIDAGEALMDERSDELWGSLSLDRDVTEAGRRALVRRVLERLERDGYVERRAAQGFGPSSGPRNGPRNGPIPTVVRFLKFREILWPASDGSAQETTQASAQDSAQENGPIPPASPPAPPVPPTAGPRARGPGGGPAAESEGLAKLKAGLEEHERSSGRLAPDEVLGGCGRAPAVLAALEAEVARLGPVLALDAAIGAADELARRGNPLRSIAALPGWLRTAFDPAHRAQLAPARRQCRNPQVGVGMPSPASAFIGGERAL